MQDEAMSTVLQGGEQSRRAGVINSPEDPNGLREALARAEPLMAEEMAEINAANVLFAVTEALGIKDFDSDAYRDLVAYPAGRAALAERGGAE